MKRWLMVIGLALMWTSWIHAAERHFDFSAEREGGAPAGWRVVAPEGGRVENWQFISEVVPTAFAPLSEKAPTVNRRLVLGHQPGETSDERFSVIVFEEERFEDFTARVRIKMSDDSGVEPVAGLVFRWVDPKNFYIVRIGGSEKNARFYKVVDGQRSPPIGRGAGVKRGEWYDLRVTCHGNQIQAWLNDEEILPLAGDNSFSVGNIGFAVRGGSGAAFSDLHLEYRPLKSIAEILVEETVRNQPRLVDLRIFGKTEQRSALHVMAAKGGGGVGEEAGETAQKVFGENQTYYKKDRKVAVVTSPLHDRNGEVIGVAEFHLERFPGQTESVTIARVLPMVRRMQQRIGGSRNLVE